MHPFASARDQSDRIESASRPTLSLSDESRLSTDELALLSAWRAARSAPRDDSRSDQIVVGDIVIDRSARTVTRAGRHICLSPKEYDLLVALGLRADAAVHRDVLMHEVWNGARRINSRTLDQHISQLRQKIEDHPHNPDFILTVSKFGYRLASRRLRPTSMGGHFRT
jgi:DNA-binding response OmpR family regulator